MIENRNKEGLPFLERLFIKNILIPIVRKIFTWEMALKLLKREVNIIQKLVQNLEKDFHQEQLLIDRVFAIEEDTRQYSVNMILEHLTIAGVAIKMVIERLSQEQEFPREIKIEAVKPKENKENQLKEFIVFYESYFNFIESLDKKKSKVTKKHPWFSEFNNFDWSVFMFMHTYIHRRQIEVTIKEIYIKEILWR